MTAQLATLTPTAHLPTEARSVSTQAMVFDPQTLANMQRMAETMAGARITSYTPLTRPTTPPV